MSSHAVLPRLALALALGLTLTAPVRAQEAATSRPTVDLSAEASRRAPNDLAFASAYFEAQDASPARLAQRVNETIAAALAQARAYPDVSTRSAGVHTWPVYGKDGRRIEGWRMRSDLQLESRNLPAMSELVGRLQGNLAIAQLAMRPAPDTEKRTADEAATEAIRAFEGRAKAISATLGKQYRIRHLSVAYGSSGGPVRPMMRAMAMAAEAAPAPIEAGDSEVSVTVSGTIELLD